MPKTRVLVIVGPTASGKSNLAVKLARRLNGEIISADSRQVYKGLDIGTGKITKREMRGVPHYLLDIADPKKPFSVALYKTLATDSLQKIMANSRLPIIVGGTGLYIDALTSTLNFPNVPPNKKLRERLNKKSAAQLFRMLEKKDPKRAMSIDRHNKVRLIRALEIVATLGRVPPLGNLVSKWDFIYIGLKPSKTGLEKNIYDRLLKRVTGIIRECKKLHKQGLSYKRMYELGLEYRYIGMYLQGKLSREETIKKLYTEIRRYSKRQMTWFRRNKKIEWFEPEEYKKIEKYVKSQL
jgi:tRNA dimethylallyltransferase